MKTFRVTTLVCLTLMLGWSAPAHGYSSAEALTAESYQYGRFEASIKFPSGSGVIGAFFLWKDGSEIEGTFWNELDFETLGFDCHLETNAYYGNPAQYHVEQAAVDPICGDFHTLAFEWTPDYVAWLVDGEEVRRDTGEAAAAFRDNATEGMQFRFNVWPGDATFGGTFDPSLLPVYQHIDWVQYSSYDGSGFVLEWREDFDDGTLPPEWVLGTWDSPKGLSTHFVENAGVVDGALVLALTADDALGIPGVAPTTGAGGVGGTGGTSGTETTGSAGTGIGGNGGTGTETASSTVTTTGTVSGSVGTTSVGGTTAAGGAAGTTASSVSGATTNSSVTATSTNNSAVSTTAAVSTTGTVTTTGAANETAALTATNGSGGSAAAAADDSSGCACRSAGGATSGSIGNLAGLTLLALGALGIRRRNFLARR